jgi:3-oxoacyl-[acyl-carrier-protein] synthase II
LSSRVVITGLGAICPVGNDVPSIWDSLVSGRSGIASITLFDASGFETRIAGEVKDFDPKQFIDAKEARRMDRFVHLATVATLQATESAGLEINSANRDRTGVIIGSGIGGIGTLSDQIRVLNERGPGRVSPFLVPMMIADIASGQISILTGARGPNFCVTSACSSGADAVGTAAETIRRGDADVMIAGGAEAPVTPIGVAGFMAMKALSTRNEDPEAASRPFDAARDGFVIGEGAAVLILESLEHATSRGASVLAEITAYAGTGDAHHITAPDPEGEGARNVMEAAMKKAGISPSQVDYLNAHGTSTPLNDKIETAAIKKAFGAAANGVAISSTKSMTGHLLGAAGALEALVCVKAIQEGICPPTINYQNPDPECDLDYVPNQARIKRIDVAMSNAFGFGGHNVCLILIRFQA